MAKKKKKPVRGSGFSVDLPTEPLAGPAKDKPIMAVIIPEAALPDVEIRLGETRSFRVGGPYEAFMERRGPAPDSEFRIVTDGDNAESITVEYEHALEPGKPQKVVLAPGRILRTEPRRLPPMEDDRTELGMIR